MHPTIEYILFDLDGTLYSDNWGLEKAVGSRVIDFIAGYLKLPREKAQSVRLSKVMNGTYGTTVEWLMAEENLVGGNLDKFFDCIHPENEADVLPPDPALRVFLQSFAARGIPIGILTNSTMEHARRILTKLGVADLFPTIIDIRKNNLVGKPDQTMYRRVLGELGVPAPSCLLIDDVPRYIEGYRAVGGTGVLFDENDHHIEFPGFCVQKLEEMMSLRWPDGSPLFA
jgi:pyrimidine 5'-nucleotidase